LIPAGERSGLLTLIAATETGSSCVLMKSLLRFSNSKERFVALRFFEIARVLVRFDHIANCSVHPNHAIM
jgi:hypothetical protein